MSISIEYGGSGHFQQLSRAAIGALAAKVGKVCILPIRARCSKQLQRLESATSDLRDEGAERAQSHGCCKLHKWQQISRSGPWLREAWF